MPTINQILDKKKGSKKGFVKKEYRPYNMDKTVSSAENTTHLNKQENISESSFIKEAPLDCDAPNTQQEENISDLESREGKTSVDRVNVAPPLEIKDELSSTPSRASASISFGFSETLETSTEDLLIQLSGRQKELLVLIIGNLIDNKSLITSPIQSQKLIDRLGATAGTVKNTVRRLEAKGFIKSVSKRGRGGFYRFQSTEEVISAGQRLFFRP